MTVATLNDLARQHLGDALGDHRASCPICSTKANDDAVNVTVNSDGSVIAHCHRCGENGSARPDRINGKRSAARARPARPPEDHVALWESGVEPGETFEHPYLTRKQVGAHGIRVKDDMLLIPMRNVAGELVGVQKIDPDGGKLYTRGAKKTCAYHAIGKPDKCIYVAEGYATGATIFEVTGTATAIAFDCANLELVAKSLHAKHPRLDLIIAADDDVATAGNPGRTAAAEAARAVGASVVTPDFGDDRPEGVSDFNDLAIYRGQEAVRDCIAQAKAPKATRLDDDAPPPNGNDRTSLRPLTVSELLRRPTPRWIVRGLLSERGFGVMFGASGSGKTFAAIDLACSIVRGVHWFGRRVQRGGVIYVASEGHLKARIEAYLVHHELDVKALDYLRIVPTTINILRPESGDLETLIVEIKRAAKELGGIVLIVLDTLNSMMAGGNENASEDMGTMIAAARRIMDTVECAALYIHHCGKDETKGSRGHSSLKAAVDVELQVTGDGDRLVEAIKLRDGEAGQRFGFRFEPVDLGPDPDPEADEGERLGSCIVLPLDHAPEKARPPVRRDVALDSLREAISEFGDRLPPTSTIPPGVKAVTLDRWRARWMLRTGYDDSNPRSVRSNFDKDRRALLVSGKIGVSKPHVWIA